VHFAAPGSLLNEPALQSAQSCVALPWLSYLPGAQTRQMVAAGKGATVPGEHGKQLVAAVPGPKRPGAQFEQSPAWVLVLAGTTNRPGSHGLQDRLPAMGATVPLAHVVQAVWPADAAKRPGAHWEHDLAVALPWLVVPGAHKAQLAAAETDAMAPAPQGRHAC
jgi:hypothetical protein